MKITLTADSGASFTISIGDANPPIDYHGTTMDDLHASDEYTEWVDFKSLCQHEYGVPMMNFLSLIGFGLWGIEWDPNFDVRKTMEWFTE